jgi:hypothetical protein
MQAATIRREEKEVPIRREDLTPEQAAEFYQLCQKHQVKGSHDWTHYSVVMTESSVDLPGFALAIADLGLLDKMPEKKRAAYLRDFSVLECP